MPAASKAKPKEKPEPAKAAGDRDAQHLQERLRQLGYGVKVDGARGPRTAAAVKLFQKDHGLRADGVVGPRTKAAMRGSSKEAIDEIRKGSKGKPAGEEAAGGASSSGGGASSAVSSPRKRVEVRSGEHRVVVYEGAEQPPRWATLVDEAWSPQSREAALLARRREMLAREAQVGDHVEHDAGGNTGRVVAKSSRAVHIAPDHPENVDWASVSHGRHGGKRTLSYGLDAPMTRLGGPPSASDRGSPYRGAAGEEVKPGDHVHVPNRIGEESGVFGMADRRLMRRGEGHVRVKVPGGSTRTVRAAELEHMSSAEEAEHRRNVGLSESAPTSAGELLAEGLVDGGWLLVEGFDQARLRRLTLDALDGLDEATLEESAKTAALSVTPSPFSTSRTSNWVARVGGLPPYIQNVAKALVRSKHSVSEAIQMAIGIVKRWAAGEGKVHGEVKAAAAKAIAQWEKKRAQSHAQSAAKAA